MSASEDGRESRTELQAWYLARLRPKLARAVAAGSVTPEAADELDRQVFELLDLEVDGTQKAA